MNWKPTKGEWIKITATRRRTYSFLSRVTSVGPKSFEAYDFRWLWKKVCGRECWAAGGARIGSGVVTASLPTLEEITEAEEMEKVRAAQVAEHKQQLESLRQKCVAQDWAAATEYQVLNVAAAMGWR